MASEAIFEAAKIRSLVLYISDVENVSVGNLSNTSRNLTLSPSD